LRTIGKILFISLAVVLAEKLIDGVSVESDSVLTVIWIAIVIALLNAFVKPFLILLTIPVTILTLGLFLLVINALIIMLAANMLDDLTVVDFWDAFWFSLILAVVNSLFEKTDKKRDPRAMRH
jgi:putative membrane protein